MQIFSPCAGRLLAAHMLLSLALQASANTDPPPAHHRSGGFQNNYLDFAPRGLAELMRWQWNAFRQGLPPPPGTPTPRVAPDLAFIQANARAGAAMQPTVTWIGHATVLAQQIGRAHV